MFINDFDEVLKIAENLKNNEKFFEEVAVVAFSTLKAYKEKHKLDKGKDIAIANAISDAIHLFMAMQLKDRKIIIIKN